MPHSDTEPRHTFRTVVQRTGISPRVLRNWEERHGAVRGVEVEARGRLYSETDVVRLQILRRLSVLGHEVAEIARFPTDALVGMLGSSAESPLTGPRAIIDVAVHFEEAVDAVAKMDEARLQAVLTRALVALSRDEFVDAIILPLLWEAGEMWAAGAISPAHEHVLSIHVRRLMHWLVAGITVLPDAPVALTVTPAGERHEFGALLATVIAAEEGWRVTYLGPDLPSSDIAAAVQARRPDVLILSTVQEESSAALPSALREIRAASGDGYRIVAGGPASVPIRTEIEPIGGSWLCDLAGLRRTLRRLRPAAVAT